MKAASANAACLSVNVTDFILQLVIKALLHQRKKKKVWVTFIANTHLILNQQDSEQY